MNEKEKKTNNNFDGLVHWNSSIWCITTTKEQAWLCFAFCQCRFDQWWKWKKNCFIYIMVYIMIQIINEERENKKTGVFFHWVLTIAGNLALRLIRISCYWWSHLRSSPTFTTYHNNEAEMNESSFHLFRASLNSWKWIFIWHLCAKTNNVGQSRYCKRICKYEIKDNKNSLVHWICLIVIKFYLISIRVDYLLTSSHRSF